MYLRGRFFRSGFERIRDATGLIGTDTGRKMDIAENAAGRILDAVGQVETNTLDAEWTRVDNITLSSEVHF